MNLRKDHYRDETERTPREESAGGGGWRRPPRFSPPTARSRERIDEREWLPGRLFGAAEDPRTRRPARGRACPLRFAGSPDPRSPGRSPPTSSSPRTPPPGGGSRTPSDGGEPPGGWGLGLGPLRERAPDPRADYVARIAGRRAGRMVVPYAGESRKGRPARPADGGRRPPAPVLPSAEDGETWTLSEPRTGEKRRSLPRTPHPERRPRESHNSRRWITRLVRR